MADCEQCAAIQRQNDLLANDRDGYVQVLTDENNKLRAENERLKEQLESPFMDGYETAKEEYRPLLIAAEAEVERLTAERDRQYDQNAEQITRIAALEAENERLRAALEKLSCKCPSNCDWEKHGDICPSWVARAALEEKPND